MTSPLLQIRDVPPRVAYALEQAGVPPLLARLYAARGVRASGELDTSLAQLLPPDTLHGTTAAARLLADAIDAAQPMCIVADYDCDGATACAVALRGLAALGAHPVQLRYVVPDRQRDGYGLTPAIVDQVLERHPDVRVLITVDNGIASQEGVAHAQARGLKVLITDHHLPACPNGEPLLPQADVIVNPNQPGCTFPSKAMAGVGVMFYVLLALRAELRQRGRFTAATQPRLDALLDLVALGTVADVVALDANNRRLVAQGLHRIRQGRMQPGVRALWEVAGRSAARAQAADLGFALGPRLNAAGRLADMTLGIECLLTDDTARAWALAQQLDAINRERRHVEADMREQAERLCATLAPIDDVPLALTLFDENFHEGVVGIVAGRLKDRLHRPVFVFARGLDGLLKGSGRSIPGFHLRDALDWMAKQHPGILLRFGGHAMAAGCTLAPETLDTFDQALRAVAQSWLAPSALGKTLPTDGSLPTTLWTLDTARQLADPPWGQGFEAPLFCDEVDVLSQQRVGERHSRLRIQREGQTHNAIWFGHTAPLSGRTRLAYRLSADEFQGRERLQLVVEAAVPADQKS